MSEPARVVRRGALAFHGFVIAGGLVNLIVVLLLVGYWLRH